MKLLKRLFSVIILLVVLVVGVGLFADSLVKSAIEEAGSEALGVKTTVDNVSIGLLRGHFSLSGNQIANPAGYGDGNFFELGAGNVEVSLASLLADKIEVPLIELSRLRVNLVKGAKGSNYGTILDHLNKFQGTGDASKDDGEGKRFIIKKLTIKDVVVRVVPVQELNLGALDVPIDLIELKDIGSDSDKGVLLPELAGIVVEAVLKRASASGRLPDLIKGGLDGQLSQLDGLADAGIKSLEGLTGGTQLPGGVTKGLENVKKDAAKKLKGLFGK